MIKCLALIGMLAISTNAQQGSINPTLPNPRIKESYDRFTDTTSVALTIELSQGQGREITFSVVGIISGQDRKTALPKVGIILTSRSSEWIYLQSINHLLLLLDGQDRMSLGEMKRANSDVLSRGRGVIEQLALMDVSFSAIEKLSKASTLEMKIGPDEFTLKKGQLFDLRDWVEKFPAARTKRTEK